MIALILDTETNGLTSTSLLTMDHQPEILELYMELVDLETAHVLKEWNFLFQQPIPISEEITKINCITNDMLKDAPMFKERAAEIKLAIEAAPCMIAHNLSFDREIIHIQYWRLGQTLKWPRQICTVEQTMPLKGYRLTLSGMHEELFGEKFSGAHRARQDVKALTRCAVELHKRGFI